MRRIVGFIPSHNEESLLPGAIQSLEAQTVALDHIVVVSDNSTDRTPDIAAGWGGRVGLFETHDNRAKKAGALNQALDACLPDLADEDWVLVMDADSRIVPGFVEHGLDVAAGSAQIGAIGGIFLADGITNLLGQLQAMEYVRYAREIARDGARARVLTGTATLARVGALRAIAAARASGQLPGRGIYHQDALCEDFELTLALKQLGYQCRSPKTCQVFTEVMPAVDQLWRQRTRWQRGALQGLKFYGLTRVTLPYLGQQAVMALGQLALMLLIALTGWAMLTNSLSFQPFWAVVGSVFVVERIVSVWRGGLRSRLLAAAMIPELVYDTLLTAVFCWVWLQVALRREGQWGIATIDRQQEVQFVHESQ